MPVKSIYINQLHGADVEYLTNADFKIGIVDYESSKLTRANIAELSSSGKTLISYLSVGEAEETRNYWKNGDWDNNPPSFLLGENPNFDGAHRVKFWDTTWQNLVTRRLEDIVKQGYEGVHLDVVDVYTVPEVQAAYAAAKPTGNLKKEMEDFVVSLSQRAKLINPDFKIIPNSGVDLMNVGTLSSPTSPLTPNVRYLNAIDGIGKESTFTAGDTYPVAWTAFDQRYVENALNAGKFVLGIEYPTNPATQQIAIDKMLAAGYIPFIGTRDLNGDIPAINGTITVDANLLAKATGDSTTPITFNGTNFAEVKLGNAGDDRFTMYDGNDTAFGQAGNDWISLGFGDDMGYGGSGNDTIYGLEGNDTIDGGSGNDVIFGWLGNDSLEGGDGNDFMTGDAGNDTLIGGDGDDGLYGWTGTDSMVGGDGNDFIMGEQGNDTIDAGDGNDTIYAGSENDSITTGDGNDYVLGDDGTDTIDAGDGQNTVFGGSGNDIITTGADADFVGGDAGNDSITGNGGNDILYGWTGLDTISGGDGNDLLSGEGDADLLLGGAGNDSIYGGAGNDSIQGGADSGIAKESQLSITAGDVLIGGEGADIFAYQKGGGVDRIVDFTAGVDKIQLIGFGANASYETVVQPHNYYVSWSGAWLFLGENQGIMIDGANTTGSLSANDFVFF